MKRLFAQLVPFLFLGIFIVLLTVGIIFLSYLFIIGAMVGFVLFLITVIKEKVFPNHYPTQGRRQTKQGRVIEHDDE